MSLWAWVVLYIGLYGETKNTDYVINKDKILLIVGFEILKCDLLYHFQVKPPFAITVVLILDEGGSSKKYSIKLIFLGTYSV